MMISRRRGVIAFILSGGLVLAACGGDVPAASPSPAGDNGTDNGTAEPTAEPTTEPTTLTIWTWKENHVGALEQIGADWAAATGQPVTVEVQFYPEGDGVYGNAIASATRTGTLPDLLSYWGGAHWDLAGSGVLEDLTDAVDDEWLAQFPESLHDGIVLSQPLVDSCQGNPDCEYKDLEPGAIYALPQISGATGYVFANREMLRDAGVDADNPPATWEAWVEAMEATVANDAQRGGLALGLKVPETGYLWIYRLLSWSHLGPDQYEARFESGGDWTSPASLRTFELYDQLSEVWWPAALQTDISEAEAAFGRGDAAWLVGGTFSYSTLTQAGMDGENVLAFALPTSSDDVIQTRELKPWVSLMLGITKDAPNHEIAMDFMRYLFSPNGGSVFAEAAEDLPAVAVPGAPASGEALIATQEAFSDSDEAFDETVPRGPLCEAASTVTNQAAVTLTRLIIQEMTPEQVASEFQNIFDTAWEACEG